MQVIIDAHLLLNAILNRIDGETSFLEFWDELQQQHIRGYLTETGLRHIHQYICTLQDDLFADQVVKWLYKLVEVYPVNNEISKQARDLPVGDYESAVAVVCAVKLRLSAVVTHRSQDFLGTSLQILSVDEMISRLRLEMAAIHPSPIKLNHWFQGNYSTGWLPLENLLGPQQGVFSFRRSSLSLRSGKLLSFDFGLEVTLVIKPTLTNEGMDIWAELCTVGNQSYLSQGLRIEVLNKANQVEMVAQPTGAEGSISLNFSTKKGEIFNIKVSFGANSIVETFIS